jgi:hypothetical protein
VPRPEDDAVTDPRPHEQHWLDLSEAAAMTGLDPEAIRSRARRGLIPHRTDDQGRWLVQIPPGSVTADDRARSVASSAVLGEAVAELLAEVAGLREGLARAEAGRDAAERAAEIEVALLREELGQARDRAGRLEGELRAVLAEQTGRGTAGNHVKAERDER